MHNRFFRSVLHGAVSFLALSFTAHAIAQEAREPSPAKDAAGSAQDMIVVTGSRIARPEFDSVQPIQVLGRARIGDRGYTNLAQALNEVPAFGPPGNSQTGNQSSFGPAQSFVDFFSLGSQRTLVLVNGRRFVSSNTASIFGPVDPGSQVDLNNIPSMLVERIETVAVGGAPIYGSDAIAGTVNIILREDFKGLELSGQSGISQRGDAPDVRLSAIAGHDFADGRGNIMISGEYNGVKGLIAHDRPVTARGNFFGSPPASDNSPFQRVLFPAQRYTAFTSGGTPFSADDFLATRSGIRDANGNLLQFGADGRLVPLDLGKTMRQGYISSGGNGYNLPLLTNLLTSSERYMGTAIAHYELSDNIRLFGEAWYSHSKGVNLIEQPVYNTALFDDAGTADGNLLINIGNPFLNAADRATIAANLEPGQEEFYVGRALTDLISGRSEGTVETYRFVGGLEGSFSAGEHEWKWEASANYGHSRTEGRITELVQQNFANALDAVLDGNGNIACRPGYTNATIATASSTCAPLNIFGSGQASQAARDYILTVARPVSVNSQLVLNANIQGSVFDVWGGPAEFSLGYEYRRERTSFDPGAFYYGEDNGDGTRSQYGRSIPIDPVRGGFHTNEVFGELRVPFVSPGNGISWLRTVEFDGAARYVKNSLSGGDLTWTAGGRVGFVEDLTFRGNFTRSIRSPAVTEIFNPISRAFSSGVDPCDTRTVDSGPNPAVRRANCIAAGINVADFTSNYSDFTVPVTISGNPDLDNEKANSWTVGAILQPRFLPGFSAAIDWVNISLKNAIVSLDGDDILNACYDSGNYPNTFCGAVTRDSDGQITMIEQGYYNAASLKFAGLTATASYRVPLGTDSSIGLGVNYLYVDRLEQQVGAGDINHTRGEIGNPKHSGTINANYDGKVISALFQAQYFGKSRFNVDEADNARNIRGVDDWWLFNATLGVKVNERFGLKFIVDNVFDRQAPYPVPAGHAQGTPTYFSGIMGRYFRLSATARF